MIVELVVVVAFFLQLMAVSAVLKFYHYSDDRIKLSPFRRFLDDFLTSFVFGVMLIVAVLL